MGIAELTLLGLALVVLLVVVKGLSLSFKLVWNGLLGAVGLYVYNLLAVGIGMKPIDISIINVLIVGFFGIPGLIALIIWHLALKGTI